MTSMNPPDESILGITVLSRCGGGAYGEVYYCQDASGKRLAMKVVSKVKLGEDWRRELKGLTSYRKLTEDTPGLLRIYHVAEDDDTLVYTMEPADAVPGHDTYVPDTLARRLANGPLPQGDLLPTLEGILNGIAALHTAGFAHRDIKPENILFVGGKPKLADMGLLSPLSGAMTRLAGTLDYLPPEQRTGTASDMRTSHRHNDLYAFGKIVYCCVSGKNASDFPSIPRDMPLTLPTKLLFRLALNLCDREPTRRVSNLPEVQREFARVARLCQTGEGLFDRIGYSLATLFRNIRSMCIRLPRWIRRHWLVSTMAFMAFAAGGYALTHYLTSMPDETSIALAQTLQDQRTVAADNHPNATAFTFYDGMYSVAIPSGWSAFDHEAIMGVKDMNRFVRFIHGMIVPEEKDGNATTIITLIVHPLTANDMLNKSKDEQLALLKQILGYDIEAIALRQYTNQRLNLETVLLVGEVAPSKVLVSFAYPRDDHTLLVSVLMQQEKYEQDMGTFLAISDSLVYHNRVKVAP